MTGYELTIRLKKLRRQHVLTATEQALYHELGSICNEGDWCEVFICSNEELCRSLNISENTLINSRKKLIEIGSIYYKSGKSIRSFGEYSFTKELTTSKSEVVKKEKKAQTTSKSEVVTTPTVPATTSKFEDYSKQTKETTDSNESVPAEKSTTSKSEVVKKEKKIKTQYWQKLVDTWFGFYKEHFGIDPTFAGTAAKSLKSILSNLKKISVNAGKEWTEPYAEKVLIHFLNRAIADKWRKENFMLHILCSHFDAIIRKETKADSAENKEIDQYLEQRKKQEERTRNIGKK